jgi:predicted DNA-binding antitoxin AbrB/MazE fold protein
MTQIVTATFEHGILRPDVPIHLMPGERVRLTVEPIVTDPQSHTAAWEEFERLCEEAPIHSGGERMTRDQLHERN